MHYYKKLSYQKSQRFFDGFHIVSNIPNLFTWKEYYYFAQKSRLGCRNVSLNCVFMVSMD